MIDLELETLRAPRVELIVDGNEVLAAERAQDNLVFRALELLRKEWDLRTGVRARLVKRIPAGRGLGGGSSDAAAALVGIHVWWGRNCRSRLESRWVRAWARTCRFF